MRRRLAAAIMAATAAPGLAEDPAVLYAEHCAACHGDDGAGIAEVAPSLVDGAWIWGGDRTSVWGTIAHGVRNDDRRSRNARMPAYGADGLLYPDEIADIVAAIRLAAGFEADAEAARRGGEHYVNNCASCHGDAMEGGVTPGAPHLTGPVWLFGGSPEALAAQIHDPAYGAMPGWIDELGEAGVDALTDYVLALPADD
jgi:cytochrome c oxidase cbb3-type subunit 3